MDLADRDYEPHQHRVTEVGIDNCPESPGDTGVYAEAIWHGPEGELVVVHRHLR